jgi:hypothetical protein
MKNHFWLFVFVFAAVAGWASTTLAQGDQAPAGNSGSNGGNSQARAGMGATRQGGINPDQLKGILDLSDDQVAKLKTLLKEQASSSQDLRAKMNKDMSSLSMKVQSGASDADLKVTLEAIAEDRETMQTDEKKMEDSIRLDLTPMQQAKLLLLRPNPRRVAQPVPNAAAAPSKAGKAKGPKSTAKTSSGDDN